MSGTVIAFPAGRLARRRGERRQAIRAALETAAQSALDAADRIIAVLDGMDRDPDLEDGVDDEPSLGAPEGHESQATWLRGGDADREEDQSPCA